MRVLGTKTQSAVNGTGRRTALSRTALSRTAAVIVTLLAMVTTDVALVPASAHAAPPKPKAARDLPALPSTPAPKAVPQVPVGDFSNPPRPGDAGPGPKSSQSDKTGPKPTGFDPAASTVVDSETTATKKIFVNPDGTRTLQASPHPVRFRDPAAGGAWRDIDVTLAKGPDGVLRPRSAPSGARLGPNGDATVAAIDTPAGPIGLRHPNPGPSGAAVVVSGPNASYKGAAGGRDVTVAAIADGVEETVILPDAASPPTYLASSPCPPA